MLPDRFIGCFVTLKALPMIPIVASDKGDVKTVQQTSISLPQCSKLWDLVNRQQPARSEIFLGEKRRRSDDEAKTLPNLLIIALNAVGAMIPGSLSAALLLP